MGVGATLPGIPSGGAYGYTPTVAPTYDQSTHAHTGGPSRFERRLHGAPNNTIFGHSYTNPPAGAGQSTAGAQWLARINAEYVWGAVTNNGVGGTLMADFCGAAFGQTPWVPGNVRSQIIVDGTLNDLNNGGGTVKGQAGFRNALTALLYVLTAGLKVEETRSLFVFTGTWSAFNDARCSGGTAQQTTTQGDSCQITWQGDAVVLIVHGIDGPGATAQVTSGAKVLATVNLANQMLTTQAPASLPFCQYAIPLSGFGPGTHTVTITKVDAGAGPLRVDCYLIPAATPPNIVLVEDGPIPHVSYGGDTTRKLLNSIMEQTAALFPTATIAQPINYGWSTVDQGASCVGADQRHPNDLGSLAYYLAVAAAINSQPMSNGTSVLGTLVLPPSPPLNTPNSSGFAGTPANGTVTGGVTTIASPWAGFGNAAQFDGASVIDFGAAQTGFTQGHAFCLEFLWRPVAADTTTNSEIMGRYSSDTTVGGGNYRIYNVPSGGAGRLVFQWRDSGGTVRQIIGPSNKTAGTLYAICMDYDGATMRCWASAGGAMAVSEGTAATTTEAADATTHLLLGWNNVSGGSGNMLNGSVLDEVRLSNVSRHTAAYTPAAAPFVTDANTVILAHLDTIS